jgi:O-methyltransferase/aklanonic acid methyltransferase
VAWTPSGGVKSREVVPGVFSRHAQAYADRLESAMARGEARGRTRVLELLAVQPGERVLDLGCGPGTLTGPLRAAAGPAGLVLGVDLAEGMLRQARARADAGFQLARMDMERLGLRDGVFDAVASGHTLHFSTNLATCLAELRRVLRPGGRLAASAPGEGLAATGGDLLGQIVDELVPPMPELPDIDAARAVTRDPERATAALVNAGFDEVAATRLEELTVYDTAEDLVARGMGWWNLAWRLEQLTPSQREEVGRVLLAAVRERLGEGPIQVSGSSVLMSARVP